MDPDGSLTAPRMDFEVAGRNVSFEDVNEKEHRLAELSRFVAQICSTNTFTLLQLLC